MNSTWLVCWVEFQIHFVSPKPDSHNGLHRTVKQSQFLVIVRNSSFTLDGVPQSFSKIQSQTKQPKVNFLNGFCNFELQIHFVQLNSSSFEFIVTLLKRMKSSQVSFHAHAPKTSDTGKSCSSDENVPLFMNSTWLVCQFEFQIHFVSLKSGCFRLVVFIEP